MQNEELLFQKNTECFRNLKIRVKNSRAVISFRKETIGGKEIFELIKVINYFESRYSKVKMPLIFELGTLRFADKLSMVIFENICHYVLQNHRNVQLSFREGWDIWTEGICSSPLLLLCKDDSAHIQKFKEKYKWEIFRNHYRRVVFIDEKNNPWMLSKIASEIYSFLSPFDVDEDCRIQIQLVVSELMGNVDEHTQTECLVDIDVTEPYIKINGEGEYYGINIVVLNYSEALLGDALKNKLANKEMLNLEQNPRYQTVLEALRNHSPQFDEKYQEEDFYNIASFQHQISGRGKTSSTGGTGLTKLIRSLERMSDAHQCYVLTGNRVMYFKHQFLEYDSEHWIGFNKSNDFKQDVPDRSVLDGCRIFFPGTAYNLNFAMKKGNKHE